MVPCSMMWEPPFLVPSAASPVAAAPVCPSSPPASAGPLPGPSFPPSVRGFLGVGSAVSGPSEGSSCAELGPRLLGVAAKPTSLSPASLVLISAKNEGNVFARKANFP